MPGIDGFLGTRASLMLDIVFLAMFAVIPVMGIAIALARYRRQYKLHKQIQLTLGIVLLAAVVLFEIDMRFVSGWVDRAKASPYFASEGTSPVHISLYVHLVFAVTTALLWVYVIVQALRKFASPPVPNAYSATHKFWGRVAAIDMTLTAITGWIFYWLAFVA